MSVYSDPAWLYFIRPVGQAGPVKIGITLNPDERLRYHQKHSPLPLEYAAIAHIERAAVRERALHREFAPHRVHHDWFSSCEALDAAMAALAWRQGAAA